MTKKSKRPIKPNSRVSNGNKTQLPKPLTTKPKRKHVIRSKPTTRRESLTELDRMLSNADKISDSENKIEQTAKRKAKAKAKRAQTSRKQSRKRRPKA